MKKVALVAITIFLLTVLVMSVQGFRGTVRTGPIDATLTIKPDPPHVCQEHHVEYWFVEWATGAIVIPTDNPTGDTFIDFMNDSRRVRVTPNATGHYNLKHHFWVQGRNRIRLEFGVTLIAPIFDFNVTVLPPKPVGGIWIPVDKLGLLAPYIASVSTIVVATAITAIYIKRVKHRKENQ